MLSKIISCDPRSLLTQEQSRYLQLFKITKSNRKSKPEGSKNEILKNPLIYDSIELYLCLESKKNCTGHIKQSRKILCQTIITDTKILK